MTEQLKPCPFCGEKLEYASGYYLHPKNECFLWNLAIDSDDVESIEAWNRRV